MNPRLRSLAPVCLFLVHATSATAASLPERAADAASAYAQGKYADAARAYQAIAGSDGVSASLYYDLGAAQLAAGELGPAVLSFARAHWLAPSDRGIDAALQGARERAGLPAEETSGWQRLRSVASPDQWSALAGLALVLACAGAALWLLEPARLLVRPRAAGALHGFTAAASVTLLVSAVACVSLGAETSRAVALSPDLTLRIAPFDGAGSRGTLAVGEGVRVEERHGDFVRVQADGGRSGWVREREVGAIVPG